MARSAFCASAAPSFRPAPSGPPPSASCILTRFHADRARVLFEGIVRQRLERFGLQAAYSLAATEEDNAVARSLQHLLRAKPTVILVASTTAPAGPEDVIGRSILQVGCHVERFMAPVEPGNLLLLGYKDDVPIVSAPRLLPVRQTERRRPHPAPHARPLSRDWVGNCGTGPRWSVGKLENPSP